MFRLLLLTLIGIPLLAVAQEGIPHVNCGGLFNPPTELPLQASIVKTREDSSKIYEFKSTAGKILYFKEITNSLTYERSVFDTAEMSVLAYSFAKSFNLESVVPYAELSPGITLETGGVRVFTRPGVIQAGVSGLVTPLDEFKKKFPKTILSAKKLHAILNDGEWPRLYADWKIFWRITMQVDLNIANLAREGEHLRIFDLGDILNFDGVRKQMGIFSGIDNFIFNLPDKPWEKALHRADFRKADPEFVEIAHAVATESAEATAARFGKRIEDVLSPPRGKMSDHVAAMKKQARWIIESLNKSPFHY